MYVIDENKQKITISNVNLKENYDDSVVIAGRMIKKNHLIIAGVIVGLGVVLLGYFAYKYQQESSGESSGEPEGFGSMGMSEASPVVMGRKRRAKSL
jgi:hypothetical protein